MQWLVWGLVLGSLLFGSLPSEATIKVLVEVKHVDLAGADLVFDLILTTVGQVSFGTHKTVARTAISDPATVLASIKGMVIAFALSQYSVTIVDTEILVVGAPQ